MFFLIGILKTNYILEIYIGVGYAGFEPAASPLSGVRSNQLS